MKQQDTDWFRQSLPHLLERRELPDHLVRSAFVSMTSEKCDQVEAAAFLVALAAKGETASELASAASVLRSAMHRLDPGGRQVLDTCGTGGDGLGTFNISTAVALVVAGAGVPVVKHGNRSVSSRSGSADVLAELGVTVDVGPDAAQHTLNSVGFAFCFAPRFHPTLANVGALRRKLGVRTIFNFLGPLLNPAGAELQLLGVGNPRLLDAMAGAIAKLGTRHALLVCGDDGLDEVTLATRTNVRRVRNGVIEALEWTPADFGLDPVRLTELAADGPAHSASIIRSVLAGTAGAARRIVLANAAAGLLAAGRVGSLLDGVAVATASIDTGAAGQVLGRLTQQE